jgi:hypothetical protein
MTKACNKRLVGKAFKNSNDMHTHNLGSQLLSNFMAMCTLATSCYQLEVFIAKVKIVVISIGLKRKKLMNNVCHQVEWMVDYVYYIKICNHLLVFL